MKKWFRYIWMRLKGKLFTFNLYTECRIDDILWDGEQLYKVIWVKKQKVWVKLSRYLEKS